MILWRHYHHVKATGVEIVVSSPPLFWPFFSFSPMFLRVQNQAKLDPVSSLFTFLPFWPPTNIDVNTENGSILVDISMARNLQGPLVNERRQ